MFPWEMVLLKITGGIISIVLEPVFWLILAVIAFQYWNSQKLQLSMFGMAKYSLSQQILAAAGLGLVGGLLGSLLLTVVGVTVNNIGIEYLWPLAILLALINLRFLCFAYAGGLISLSSVLFGFPQVDVPQLIGLVAILHITESILIYLSGWFSAVPMIVRTRSGRLVGGFNLQNFWPLPLMILLAVAVPPEQIPASIIHMPDWWPLIKPAADLPAGHHFLYDMVPVVAALGYADMAIASRPDQRRRNSAVHLGIYSLLLLTMAILATKALPFKILAAVLAPFGHEFLVHLDNTREMRGKPLFVPPPYGVKILDILPGLPADKMGLKPGDIILRVNGMAVNSYEELAQVLTCIGGYLRLDIERDGEVILREGDFSGFSRLGVITVPEGNESHYVEVRQDSLWTVLKRKLRRFTGKGR